MNLNSKAFYFMLMSIVTCLFFTNSCSLDDADIVRAPAPEDLIIKEKEKEEKPRVQEKTKIL